MDLIKRSLTLALDRMEIQRALVQHLELRWDFGLTKLEQLFEAHKGTLDKRQTDFRLQVAQVMNKPSPELITKGQFKLIMSDAFKVRDN